MLPHADASSSIFVQDFGEIGDGSFHAVREWLVGGEHDRGYTSLKEIKADYPAVNSLDDSIDRIVVQTAFDSLPDGGTLYFSAGSNYVFDAPVLVEGKSVNVVMTDATVTMAPDSAYNAFRIAGTDDAPLESVTWTGGTIDGNNDKIDWPGSTNPDSAFTVLPEGVERELLPGTESWRYEGEAVDENVKIWSDYQYFGNNGLLGIHSATHVHVTGVTIKDPVSDGVVLSNVEDGTISNSQAFGGAEIIFGETLETYGRGFQATYFKGRQTETDTFDGGTFTVDNVTTTGGSIGVAFSSPTTSPVPPDSQFIVIDSSVTDAAQNGLHAEHSVVVNIHGSEFIQTDPSLQTNVFIGNRTQFSTIEDTLVDGSHITFRNATNLVEGKVVNSTVLNKDASIDNAIHNATHVIGTYVETEGASAVLADHIIDSTIAKFEWAGIRRAETVTGTTIDNKLGGGDGIGIANFDGGTVIGSTFSNLDNGIILVDGHTYVERSVFDTLKENGIQFIHADSLTILDSLFRDYGLSQEDELKEAAIGGRRAFNKIDSFTMDDATLFDSSLGNLPTSPGTEFTLLEVPTLPDEPTDPELDGVPSEPLVVLPPDPDQVTAVGNGDDLLQGGSGNDVFAGGAHDDVLIGGGGDDLLRGQTGRDTLFGGDGDDTLEGGSGADFIEAGAGTDRIVSGSGRDTITLGDGADTVVFDSSNADTTDLIYRFSMDDGDTLDLTALFSGRPTTGTIDNWVRLESKSDGKHVLFADVDGASGSAVFEKIAVFYESDDTMDLLRLVDSEQLIF